jgi:hypothetical protein
VERAFAIVILDERYGGCAMYPNRDAVLNERAVVDRRMSRDELIGKKTSAREVYSNEEYSLRLSEHRRCISSGRSDRAGKIGARHFFGEYYGCVLRKNADPAKVEEVREKKLTLKGKVLCCGTLVCKSARVVVAGVVMKVGARKGPLSWQRARG